MPAGLEEALSVCAPADASRYERGRDNVLWGFAHPLSQRIFLTLSVVTMVLVVTTGLLIAFTVLGLYLNVENGWCVRSCQRIVLPHAPHGYCLCVRALGRNTYHRDCVRLARMYNQTLR